MHQKHPPLRRPDLGKFGRTEFALLGTTCTRIHSILNRWEPRLIPYALTWILRGRPGHFGDGGTFDDRLKGSRYDLVLTNGHHFPARRQLVFLDPAKAGSLEKRRDQLTDVAAVIRCPGAGAVPKWLPTETPHLDLSEIDERVLPLLLAAVAENRPPLKGLILTGGKSSRMGTDKAKLTYHGGQTEPERLAAALTELGIDPHFSVATLNPDLPSEIPQIADRFLELGPVGAIASALLHDPASAWLVLACDLPLLPREVIASLIAARDTRRYATAVRAPGQPFPEPLVAIYEPRAYQRLLQFLSLGYGCPRKLLINSEVATLELEDERVVTNVNTVEEREAVNADWRSTTE